MDTAVGGGSFLEVFNGRVGAGEAGILRQVRNRLAGTSPEQTLHPETRNFVVVLTKRSPAAALGACARMAATPVSYSSRRTPAGRTGPARALGGERGNRPAGR